MAQADLAAVKDKSEIQTYGLGSILSGGDSDPPDISPQGWRKAVEECQSWALKTRLKIPLLYGIDAVHGHNNVNGAVIFPHNIGLGATHNAALVEQAARVTAEEVASTGIRWTFAPCIAVARDERWGRTYESFGESPDLVSELGAAAVRGLQGKDLAYPASVLACAKHFLGDGGTSNGVDQGNTVCDEATLRKIHFAPYQAVTPFGAGSIMVSFNSWNGAKMHGNKHWLTDVLKTEYGFQGFLVSDWAAIDQLTNRYKSAIEISINAGIDMVMIPNGPSQKNNYVEFIHSLKELVEEGLVPQARIDDAVHRILRAKYSLGLFEHSDADTALGLSIGNSAHRQVARDCVRQSLVLLKNDKKALPLGKNLKHLLVCGKTASDLGIQCGGWTLSWQGAPGNTVKGGTTILSAIRQTLDSGNDVTFSRDGPIPPGTDPVIVVVGETPYAEMNGDRPDLRLAPGDLSLLEQARKSGRPVITILVSGRPLVLGQGLANSDAVLAAWLPGTEGQGVADVLFGDYKPTGKLPRHWPRNNDQLTSRDESDTVTPPQFPLGFGLNY
jgi:beta-glucosidase